MERHTNLSLQPNLASDMGMNNSLSTVEHAPEPTLILHGSPSWLGRQKLAATDFAGGLRMARLIAALGWLDIRLRYRGSLLGPFWLTLSTAVMVGALGFVY
jgi:lipopolysaccharide transport system permease protein